MMLDSMGMIFCFIGLGFGVMLTFVFPPVGIVIIAIEAFCINGYMKRARAAREQAEAAVAEQAEVKQDASASDEIDKMWSLVEKGALTKEEFEEQKKKLLQ